MVRINKKCLRCGKSFWAKEEQEYCQSCRNKKRIEEEQKKRHKDKEHIHVRVVDRKIDLKKEVQGLIFLENRYPEVVEKIRSKKFNSKKSVNDSSG